MCLNDNRTAHIAKRARPKHIRVGCFSFVAQLALVQVALFGSSARPLSEQIYLARIAPLMFVSRLGCGCGRCLSGVLGELAPTCCDVFFVGTVLMLHFGQT